MNLVFLIFRDNLIDESHSPIYDNSLFIVTSEFTPFTLQYSVVSSAYINIWNIGLTLGKSLIYMYIKKSNDPKIEPWGTPIDTDFVSDWHHCNPHIDVYLKGIHEIIYFPTHRRRRSHEIRLTLTWARTPPRTARLRITNQPGISAFQNLPDLDLSEDST